LGISPATILQMAGQVWCKGTVILRMRELGENSTFEDDAPREKAHGWYSLEYTCEKWLWSYNHDLYLGGYIPEHRLAMAD